MKNCVTNVVTTVTLLALTATCVGSSHKEENQVREENLTTPIRIDLTRKGFASFTNSRHPGNKIGYRFFEHSPLVYGAIPQTAEEAGVSKKKSEDAADKFSNRQGVVVYRHPIRKEEGWEKQYWTFHMAPTDDGIDLLWVIETGERGLPLYYGVQQCFRLGGSSNADWRRRIAETPAFSEYDLWESQKDVGSRTSLSWVLRNDEWEALPAIREGVGARTPLGMKIDNARFQMKLPDVIGPYKAVAQDPVYCGLITRTDVEGKWICGIYWEGTSHVTNHHPADCLHAIVNVGNVPAHSKRSIRGKIYWFKGSKNDLLTKWRTDFPEPPPE